jgi:hypothetical protein
LTKCPSRNNFDVSYGETSQTRFFQYQSVKVISLQALSVADAHDPHLLHPVSPSEMTRRESKPSAGQHQGRGVERNNELAALYGLFPYLHHQAAQPRRKRFEVLN